MSGPETVLWTDFYGAYEQMLGKRSVVFMSTEELPAQWPRDGELTLQADTLGPAQAPRLAAPSPRVHELARRHLKLTDVLARRAKQAPAKPAVCAERGPAGSYSARTVVRLDKARRLLGYRPRFSFARGMDLTARYVSWANLSCRL